MARFFCEILLIKNAAVRYLRRIRGRGLCDSDALAPGAVGFGPCLGFFACVVAGTCNGEIDQLAVQGAFRQSAEFDEDALLISAVLLNHSTKLGGWGGPELGSQFPCAWIQIHIITSLKNTWDNNPTSII